MAGLSARLKVSAIMCTPTPVPLPLLTGPHGCQAQLTAVYTLTENTVSEISTSTHPQQASTQCAGVEVEVPPGALPQRLLDGTLVVEVNGIPTYSKYSCIACYNDAKGVTLQYK